MIDFKILHSKLLGKKAFLKGLKRIPVQDDKLLKLTKNCLIGEWLIYGQAWLNGWDKENLKND